VGAREARSEQAFDGAEGALDRSLLGRGTFFLGLVLDLESLAGSARGLGKVGSALVDEELGAGQLGEGLGDDLDDDVGVLLGPGREGREQVLAAASWVLGGDQPQVDAEGRDRGGVSEGLEVRRAELECEAALVSRAGRFRRSDRGQRCSRPPAPTGAPGAEGALGDAEGVAEEGEGEAMPTTQVLGGDDDALLEAGITDAARLERRPRR